MNCVCHVALTIQELREWGGETGKTWTGDYSFENLIRNYSDAVKPVRAYNGRIVWVVKDSSHQSWYQGHVFDGDPLIEALFLKQKGFEV